MARALAKAYSRLGPVQDSPDFWQNVVPPQVGPIPHQPVHGKFIVSHRAILSTCIMWTFGGKTLVRADNPDSENAMSAPLGTPTLAPGSVKK
jgi:hypothetical protein